MNGDDNEGIELDPIQPQRQEEEIPDEPGENVVREETAEATTTPEKSSFQKFMDQMVFVLTCCKTPKKPAGSESEDTPEVTTTTVATTTTVLPPVDFSVFTSPKQQSTTSPTQDSTALIVSAPSTSGPSEDQATVQKKFIGDDPRGWRKALDDSATPAEDIRKAFPIIIQKDVPKEEVVPGNEPTIKYGKKQRRMQPGKRVGLDQLIREVLPRMKVPATAKTKKLSQDAKDIATVLVEETINVLKGDSFSEKDKLDLLKNLMLDLQGTKQPELQRPFVAHIVEDRVSDFVYALPDRLAKISFSRKLETMAEQVLTIPDLPDTERATVVKIYNAMVVHCGLRQLDKENVDFYKWVNENRNDPSRPELAKAFAWHYLSGKRPPVLPMSSPSTTSAVAGASTGGGGPSTTTNGEQSRYIEAKEIGLTTLPPDIGGYGTYTVMVRELGYERKPILEVLDLSGNLLTQDSFPKSFVDLAKCAGAKLEIVLSNNRLTEIPDVLIELSKELHKRGKVCTIYVDGNPGLTQQKVNLATVDKGSEGMDIRRTPRIEVIGGPGEEIKDPSAEITKKVTTGKVKRIGGSK